MLLSVGGNFLLAIAGTGKGFAGQWGSLGLQDSGGSLGLQDSGVVWVCWMVGYFGFPG